MGREADRCDNNSISLDSPQKEDWMLELVLGSRQGCGAREGVGMEKREAHPPRRGMAADGENTSSPGD